MTEPANKPKVLIAEDDEVLRPVLCRTMEWEGYQVVVAADGQDALRLLAEPSQVDLIITDSQFSRQKIMEYFSPRVAPTVVYPASPLQAESTPDARQRDEKFFLFCGGYEKRKGIELLLNAKLVDRKNFNWNLNLTGAYNRNEILSVTSNQFFQ